MALTDSELEEYLAELTPEQTDAIRRLRSVILSHAPGLAESIDRGKWWGGLLTYNTPSGYGIYALGPRGDGMTTLHMMPYYSSATLQARHGAVLKKLLTGKSCLRFRTYEDVPAGVIEDIVGTGTQPALDELAKRAKKKR